MASGPSQAARHGARAAKRPTGGEEEDHRSGEALWNDSPGSTYRPSSRWQGPLSRGARRHGRRRDDG
eukprot:6621980-Alexandrium_andersonii.AAC.1